MDIKFNIKGLSVIRGQIKVEDIDFGVSGTSEEVLNSNECILELIDNPAVQRLINKFTEEVNFAPSQSNKAEAKTEELLNRVNELVSSLKKERETDSRIRRAEKELYEKFNCRMKDLTERTQKF